jgi:hypothetical protein
MRKPSFLTGVSVAFFAFVLLTDLSATVSLRAQDKPKEEPKTTELHLLTKNAGATFGDWVVWRYEEGGAAVFLINQKTGFSIYLPWSSNGWINYRDKGGEWYVLFSKGEAEKQNRDDLPIAKFLEKKRPAVALEAGKYTFKDWTVKVTKDHIDFHSSTYDDRFTVQRSSGEVTHNGRSIGAKP